MERIKTQKLIRIKKVIENKKPVHRKGWFFIGCYLEINPFYIKSYFG